MFGWLAQVALLATCLWFPKNLLVRFYYWWILYSWVLNGFLTGLIRGFLVLDSGKSIYLSSKLLSFLGGIMPHWLLGFILFSLLPATRTGALRIGAKDKIRYTWSTRTRQSRSFVKQRFNIDILPVIVHSKFERLVRYYNTITVFFKNIYNLNSNNNK